MEKEFDFLAVLKRDQHKTYRLLYPGPRAGMVILWLYEQHRQGAFPEKTFREETIQQACRELFGHNKSQWEDYADIVSDLSEFFLRYDDQLRVFSLKNYALEFCLRAYEVLHDTFNPTRIEKICAKLRRELDEGESESELLLWFETSFKAFQPELKSQIDYLERQIQESVDELRRHAHRDDMTMQQALGQVVRRLNEIKEQNQELTAAFHEIDRIKLRLDNLQTTYRWLTMQELIDDAFAFFAEMLYALRVVDRRIDRIQPKLRQLFGTLNQPLFNGRVELFLRHLLVDSQLLRDGPGHRSLHLPPDATLPLVHILTPSLAIIERRVWLGSRPTRSKRPAEDQQLRRRAFAAAAQRVRQQSVVAEWMNRFEQLLRQQKRIEFDGFFQTILNEEPGNVDLAVRVAYTVFREYTNHPRYTLRVLPDLITVFTPKPLSLWQMSIWKR